MPSVKKLAPVLMVAAVSCVGTQRVASAPKPAAANRQADLPEPIIVWGSSSLRGSPIQLGEVDGRSFAWVADSDDKRIRAIDMEKLEEESSIDLGGTPSEMVMLEDGSIVAALRDTNEIVRIGHGAVRARLAVAVEPIGLALTPDARTLLVTSGWSHTLTVVDVLPFTRRYTLDLAKEPRAVVVADWSAWIAHATGSTLERVEISTGTVKKLELEGWRESFGHHGWVGQSAAPAVQGFALAVTDGDHPTLFVPRVLAQTFRFSFEDDDGMQGDSYGGGDAFPPESLDVARVDGKHAVPELESLVLRAGFDDTHCILPRAALAKGERLFVACLGTDSVVELDGGFPAPHHAEIRRTKVPPGPLGLAVDDKHDSLVVWSAFARELSVIPLSRTDDDSTALPIVSLAKAARDPMLVRGKLLFHSTTDDRISTDGRGCASCHIDGREDGLVWQTSEGPRQTPMLAGRLDKTAPYGWRGQELTVEEHLKAKSFKRLGGKGLPPDDVAALLAYVRSIPVPEEKKIDPALVLRGEAIFNSEKTQCAECHGRDGVTPDGLDHNVRSWSAGDVRALFDTPSLRAVAHTAPYFHDGRYQTLGQLLRSVDGTMGHTKQLTPEELEALETYVRTR
jgi:mono/diheme cytochrome c family protein